MKKTRGSGDGSYGKKIVTRRGPSYTLLFRLVISIVLVAFGAADAAVQPMVRLKDLVTIEGVRDNQLVGMGLVVGLQGTGDKGRMAMQMMSNMTQQFGVTIDPKLIKSKNAAVVSVTCQLSPFLLPGQNTDVLVSAMGDAKSLEGGVLLQTPLKAANGRVYAVAQGPLTIGGWSVTGAAAEAKGFSAKTAAGDTLTADVVVLAAGVSRSAPSIPGLKDFIGRGVSYCAMCDAPFYRGKTVAVEVEIGRASCRERV